MIKGLITLLCAVLALASCSVLDNKEEGVPTYIRIDDIGFETTEGQGTDDHKITHAWVYANDQFVGAYEVPALVPVLNQGNTEIKVSGGIEYNGISAYPGVYPHLDFFTANLTMNPGATIDFSEDSINAGENSGRRSFPVLSYFPSGLNFQIEDFEDQVNGNTFGMDITNNEAEVFEGNASGKIELNDTTFYYLGLSSWNLQDVRKGSEVFLELNYKTDFPIEVGAYTLDPFQQKIFGKGINAKNQWNKIYIQLTNEFASQVNTSTYEIYIEISKAEGTPDGTVLLDNIKLIYPD